MEQYRPVYSDNDLNLTPFSSVHITLCFRGPPPAKAISPAYPERIPPISRSSPWLQPELAYEKPTRPAPIQAFNSNATTETVQQLFEVRHQNLLSTETQYRHSVPVVPDSPTFVFGVPSVDEVKHQNHQTLTPCIEVKRAPIDQQRCAPVGKTARPEYDPATLGHFQQHLGVIDLRHDQVHQGSSVNHAMNSPAGSNEYTQQLMLLEKQNNIRLARARKQQVAEQIRAAALEAERQMTQ